jgi:dihydrolipoamide dehydrogenase
LVLSITDIDSSSFTYCGPGPMLTPMTKSTDVVIIGAGTAGLAAYRAAVARTSRVLLVENGVGGTTCARVGCMPSKLLIAAAEAAHHARTAAPFGVHAKVEVDGIAVMDRVRRERDRFVGFVLEGYQAIPAEHRLRGTARFLGPNMLDVAGTLVETKASVVATGSSPFVPAVFDSIRDRLVVNDDVFAWRGLPESVAVFGTGVIGIELGQALHRLGVRVKIFGKGGKLGPITDPVVHRAALHALSAEIEIDLDAEISSVVRADGPNGILVDGERFDTALVAAGRRPNVFGLGLDPALLSKIDRNTLQMGDQPIFVAGDANNQVPLLHEAADDGRIAGDNAARYPEVVPSTRRSPLAIAFGDPQIAIVGATFAQLSERDPLIGEVQFLDQGRSRVMRQNHGAARVYFDRQTKRFLGAEMAGPRAENIGHLLAWAHQAGLTLDQMLAMPFYHPVVEEGIRTALRNAKEKDQEEKEKS